MTYVYGKLGMYAIPIIQDIHFSQIMLQQQDQGDETNSLLDQDLDIEVEDGQMDEDIQEDEEVPKTLTESQSTRI